MKGNDMQERKDNWSVGQWMTQNPSSVSSDTPVKSAFYRMRREGYRHLPVVDDGRLVGIVTDRDLRRPDLTTEPDGWNDYYRLDDQTEVRHVMTERVDTLSPSDPLEKALSTFIEWKFGAMPVLDKNGDLLGILTSYDLLRAFQVALAESADLLRSEGSR
ncbi:MAG: CBS domain-containing protein [Thermoanaerobaculia bacterium]|nr:CBS domain-containing protein [Thermoanaerobaculia bacterium]